LKAVKEIGEEREKAMKTRKDHHRATWSVGGMGGKGSQKSCLGDPGKLMGSAEVGCVRVGLRKRVEFKMCRGGVDMNSEVRGKQARHENQVREGGGNQEGSGDPE